MRTRRQAAADAAKEDKKENLTKKQILEEKVKATTVGKDKGKGNKKVKVDKDTSVAKTQVEQPKTKRQKAKEKQKRVSPIKETKKQEKKSKPKAKEDTDDSLDLKKLNPSKEKVKEKQEVKKVQMKGKVPIDDYFPLDKNLFHVLEHQGKVYSATLNQTSVTANSNKFYLIQILQKDSDANNCYFYTRWGRVGVPGQVSNMGPTSIMLAIRNYDSKYHQKHNKGNYREIDLNYLDEEEVKSEKEDKKKSQKKEEIIESKLPKQVKSLIELIFDLNMMNKAMVEIGYNVKKMPLGKLSKDNIMKGYKILEDLLKEVQGLKRLALIQEYTDEFYSYIPHDFGFQHMSLFVLNTEDKVKEKLAMLEALAEIKVATNIISRDVQGQNRLDSNYKKLNRDITPIDRSSEEFSIINKYLQSTHGSTHRYYDLQIVDLFSLNDERQNIRYQKDIGNKMLLWHGSRLTNYVGILSQGLRIAPPQAPVNGYMFGKGVYFADMSSKSANYCYPSQSNTTGILLLCEVALGEWNEKLHADPYAANLPPGKLSTKGVGRTAPNPANQIDFKGMKIPMGPGEQFNIVGGHLQYNEFIVYDISQIRIRYLLRTKFNYKKY